MNDDLISRDALKREFKKIYHIVETAEQLANTMEDAINNAPTVEIPVARWDCYCEGQKVGYEKALSERPQGKWVRTGSMTKRSYQRMCDNCHNIVYFCGKGNYPNCPYCLADMKGGAE